MGLGKVGGGVAHKAMLPWPDKGHHLTDARAGLVPAFGHRNSETRNRETPDLEAHVGLRLSIPEP